MVDRVGRDQRGLAYVSRRTLRAVSYLSYDGLASPLGQSQVLAYLERLSSDAAITLISFEGSSAPAPDLAQRLSDAGVRWVRLRYHKKPPVLSTAWDITAGIRALRREAARRSPDIVHARSYVPMAIAVLARTRGRLLFDIRGFWADERVEGEIWRPGGLLYRVTKRLERRFFAVADAVVTLTAASVPQIRRWLHDRDVPIEVIPTCANVARFQDTTPRPGGPHAVWCGSVTTWYRFDLGVRLAQALGLPFTVLTRQTEEARALLGGQQADVRQVEHADIARNLCPGDIGLCLYKSTFSRVATAPTRFAEYLSAGMPVAVTPGVGDLEQMVEIERVGVVVRDVSDGGLAVAARELLDLAGDPAVRERCRRLARERYDVEAGTASYRALYERLVDRRSRGVVSPELGASTG